jgi:hypothetical protein
MLDENQITRIFLSMVIGQPTSPLPPPRFGSQCTTAYFATKTFFSKSAQNWQSRIFATKRPTGKIKNVLDTSFLCHFFVFYYLPFEFKLSLQGKIVM